MANKTTLQSLSDTNLASGVGIPAADHRAVNDAFLDEFYATPVTESYTNLADNTPNTTPNSTTHYYRLDFLKQGTAVFINGTLTNKTGSITTNEKWLDIDAGEYTQDSNSVKFVGVSTSTGNNVRCELIGSELKVVGALGNNEQIEVDTKYYTQD